MMKQNENEMNFSVPLEIIKASEIEPKEVKWLWYPYIPFGKVTLLQGDPGDGKSKLMLSIAALLSKGEPLPFTETEENEPMTMPRPATPMWPIGRLVTPKNSERNMRRGFCSIRRPKMPLMIWGSRSFPKSRSYKPNTPGS